MEADSLSSSVRTKVVSMLAIAFTQRLTLAYQNQGMSLEAIYKQQSCVQDNSGMK